MNRHRRMIDLKNKLEKKKRVDHTIPLLYLINFFRFVSSFSFSFRFPFLTIPKKRELSLKKSYSIIASYNG